MGKYATRGEAIKDLRKKAGLSQEELAKKLNTTKQTIYKYESGIVTNIPSDKIEMMSRIFGVSPAVIMGWDIRPTYDFHLFGEDPEDNAPLFEAAAGEARHTEWYSTEGYNITLESDEVAVRVVGRSMEPTLLDGDVVIVCAQNIIDYPRQIALVKVNGDEATIKRVEIKENGVMLMGDNVDVYPPHFYTEAEVRQLPVEIQGIVTRLIRDIE